MRLKKNTFKKTKQNQNPLISQTSVGQNSGTVWLDSLPRVSGAEIKVLSRLSSSLEAPGNNALISSIRVVGRNQFLVVAGLRSLFLCWLTAGGCARPLETTHIPCHRVPPSSKPAMENLFCIESLMIQSSLFQKNPVSF